MAVDSWSRNGRKICTIKGTDQRAFPHTKPLRKFLNRITAPLSHTRLDPACRRFLFEAFNHFLLFVRSTWKRNLGYHQHLSHWWSSPPLYLLWHCTSAEDSRFDDPWWWHIGVYMIFLFLRGAPFFFFLYDCSRGMRISAMIARCTHILLISNPTKPWVHT